jgi:hypothetical protein
MASVAGSVENGSMFHVDEAQIRGHVDEVFVRVSRRRSRACWKPKRTSCVVRSDTSEVLIVWIRGRDLTIASCKRRLAR